MHVKLINKSEHILDTMYVAARTCYSAESPIDIKVSDKPFKLIKKVLDSGHLSIAEHISFTFAIEGISRACSLQIIRHRHCSFSQQSQRYVNMKNAEFVVPYGLKKEENDKIGALINYTMKTYNELIEAGVKQEDARAILPNCCTTNMVMTCNLRELMHICNLRMCTRAQKEVRELVTLMANEVIKVVPEMKEYLVPNCERLGFCTEHNGCGRKPSK